MLNMLTTLTNADTDSCKPAPKEAELIFRSGLFRGLDQNKLITRATVVVRV